MARTRRAFPRHNRLGSARAHRAESPPRATSRCAATARSIRCGSVTLPQAGHLYFAVLLDPASRRPVGWSIDVTLATTLLVRALHVPINHRQPLPGLVLHSDRGTQGGFNREERQLLALGDRQVPPNARHWGRRGQL